MGPLTRFAHCYLWLAILGLLWPQAAQAAVAGPSQYAALNRGSLPLTFAPNVGQAAPDVSFIAHSLGASLYFARHDIVVAVAAADVQDSGNQSRASANLRIRWQGANPDVKLERVAAATTRLNYFIGRDPGRWRRNVTAYSEVAYRRLYPGIDLFLTGAGGSLQGSYVVAPAADPMGIR